MLGDRDVVAGSNAVAADRSQGLLSEWNKTSAHVGVVVVVGY